MLITGIVEPISGVAPLLVTPPTPSPLLSPEECGKAAEYLVAPLSSSAVCQTWDKPQRHKGD